MYINFSKMQTKFSFLWVIYLLQSYNDESIYYYWRVGFSEAAALASAKPQAAKRSPTALLHGVVNGFGSPSLARYIECVLQHPLVAMLSKFCNTPLHAIVVSYSLQHLKVILVSRLHSLSAKE